jgi:hypothetical protein
MKYLLSLIIGGALVVSGFGQTRNVLVGTNNAVVQPTNFWSADAVNARSGLGLGTAATNPASAFQPSSAVLSNLAAGSGIAITNIAASNIVGAVAVVNGGTGATNAATARTNLGLGSTNVVEFNEIVIGSGKINYGGGSPNGLRFFDGTNEAMKIIGDTVSGKFSGSLSGSITLGGGASITFDTPSFGIAFNDANARNITRTNLGLGWSALTNSNSATALLGYDTNNGNVIMPSSITFSNNVDFSKAIFARTNGVSAGGTLFVGSGSTISFSGEGDKPVWRTNLGLGLPALTNTNNVNFLASFFGSNTNPVLVNTNGEVVSPTNFWQVAPISTTVQYQTNVTGTSTNAATNSRNLFLFSLSPSVSGITNTVTLPTNTATTFEGDRATIIHLAQTTNAVTAIRQLGAATNLITINQLDEAVLLMYRSGAWMLADNISYVEPIFFSGTNAATNAAASRTNLGLGLPALTNTNNASFRTAIELGNTNNASFLSVEVSDGITIGDNTNSAIYFEGNSAALTRTNLGLGATNNVSFSNVTASGTLTATGEITATTNLVVNGFVNFSTNHTNSNPATNNQIQDFIEIRLGTNQFWLPLYK